MRSAGLLRNVVLLGITVSATVALVFGVNAVVRPGCSLLPLTVSGEEYASRPATPEEACAVLGRPLPRPGMLPTGARMAQIGIDSPPPPGFDCCRMILVSYSTGGRNFALLTIHRQDAIPAGNVGQINATLAGVPAVIEQRHLLSRDADDVSYLWARDGLLHSLHVNLTDGITREAADAMAASIR